MFAKVSHNQWVRLESIVSMSDYECQEDPAIRLTLEDGKYVELRGVYRQAMLRWLHQYGQLLMDGLEQNEMWMSQLPL